MFPPFTDLRSVQTLVNADDLPIAYGGQDLSEHDSGAYTGEISGAFLAALDSKYVTYILRITVEFARLKLQRDQTSV